MMKKTITVCLMMAFLVLGLFIVWQQKAVNAQSIYEYSTGYYGSCGPGLEMVTYTRGVCQRRDAQGNCLEWKYEQVDRCVPIRPCN